MSRQPNEELWTEAERNELQASVRMAWRDGWGMGVCCGAVAGAVLTAIMATLVWFWTGR